MQHCIRLVLPLYFHRNAVNHTRCLLLTAVSQSAWSDQISIAHATMCCLELAITYLTRSSWLFLCSWRAFTFTHSHIRMVSVDHRLPLFWGIGECCSAAYRCSFWRMRWSAHCNVSWGERLCRAYLLIDMRALTLLGMCAQEKAMASYAMLHLSYCDCILGSGDWAIIRFDLIQRVKYQCDWATRSALDCINAWSDDLVSEWSIDQASDRCINQESDQSTSQSDD